MDFSHCTRLSRNVIDRTKNPDGSQLDDLKGLSLSQWEKATAHTLDCQQSLDAQVKAPDPVNSHEAPAQSTTLMPQPR